MNSISASNAMELSGMEQTDEYKCNGSVLEKLSLFEKLEHRQMNAIGQLLTTNKCSAPPHYNNEAVSTIKRSDYISKSSRSIDKDAGMYRTFELS